MSSNRLKEIRLLHNLTQKTLSEELNIGQATIACYENGSREPHITILTAYANFFQCSIDYLIGREDDFGNIYAPSKQKSNELSADEADLIKIYRKLPDDLKERTLMYVNKLLELIKDEQQPFTQKNTRIIRATSKKNS